MSTIFLCLENVTNMYHDLAVLRFQQPMTKKDWKWNSKDNDAIYPICLPGPDYEEVWKTGR